MIVLDMTNTLACTRAEITSNNTLKHAMTLIEHDGLDGVILDHALGDGDSSGLCARLTELGVPYLIYSGFKRIDGPCHDAPHLDKPATPDKLVEAVEKLIIG